MVSSFELFKKQIDEALEVLDSKYVIEENGDSFPDSSIQMVDTQSLIDRCSDICEHYETTKPTIRILHQLASTGGTLMSKCLAAMPNTFLLSEVHPYSNLHMLPQKSLFLPNDIMTQCKQAGVPQSDKLADEIFLNSIKSAYEHVNSIGGVLILRDHSHSDYCLGDGIRGTNSIINILKEDFNILSAVTLRDPVDTFLSMEKSRFLHFSPSTYAEYCDRVEAFISAYESAPVFQYENFVENPKSEMEKLCKSLDIEFNPLFEDTFSLFSMSGDSGRSGSFIEKRDRVELPEKTDFSKRNTPKLSTYYKTKESLKN